MLEQVMINYERIIKDCFWDLKIDAKEIDAILLHSDMIQKTFLFEKILLNSTQMLADMQIFEKGDLEILIENFKVPKFNAEYIFKRKNMAEVYFLDKPLEIDELKWIA